MEEAGQEIPEFLEQYKDGPTTQTEKKFDALEHHDELSKFGTEVFNMQAAGSDSWNNPAISSSDSAAFNTQAAGGDTWNNPSSGSTAQAADDGWGAGTAEFKSTW